MEIEDIVSLPLKITYLSIRNGQFRLICESNPIGWIFNRRFYEFRINTTGPSFFEFHTCELTGQSLLETKMKVKLFLEHTNILYSSTPGECIAIMYEGEIALKGTEKYKLFKNK